MRDERADATRDMTAPEMTLVWAESEVKWIGVGEAAHTCGKVSETLWLFTHLVDVSPVKCTSSMTFA
jgi:hypothetical protein